MSNEEKLVNLVGGGDAHSPHPTDKERVWATDTKVCSPTNNIIPQTQENQSIAEQSKDFNHLSISQRLDILEKNQQAIAGMQSTKDLQQQNKDSMSIKQEAESKDSKSQESQMHKLKKRK